MIAGAWLARQLGRNWLGIFVVVAAGLAIWWLVALGQDFTRLKTQLAAAKTEIALARVAQKQALETARIHRAHLDRAADQARQWDALSNDLQELEGRNAPLSPVLRTTAERLFGPR